MPLQIDADPAHRLGTKTVRQIWEFLPTPDPSSPKAAPPRLAILADPGYGKTTLMRHLSLNFANRKYRDHQVAELVPVLLLFREIHPRIQDRQTPTLPDLIVEHLKSLPACKKLSPTAQWFRDKLERGKCLVMLDGLDEVPESQRQKVSQWANWQIQAYATPAIVTSRPHGYDSSLFTGVQTVKVLDFTPDDTRRFIDRWYEVMVRRQKWDVLWRENQQKPEAERLSKEAVEATIQAEAKTAADDLSRQIFASSDLTKLAKNPLLITIIAATHRAYESLPSRRVRLYQKMFNLLLEDRPNRRETRLTLAVEENLAVLQVLAFCLTQQGETQFTPEQGKAWIAAPLAACPADTPLTPAQFLREIQRITGLLVGEDCDLYEFTHKTFQEYLAAVEIKHPEQVDILKQNLKNDKWREVIRFYAALGNASTVIDWLLEPPDRYTLTLARDIKQDGNRIDAERLNRVEQAILEVNLESTAQIQLAQQFRQEPASEQPIVISDYIRWAEYQLFLEAQTTGQFHSTAAIPMVPVAGDLQTPIMDLAWTDARWFCAWLATQPDFQSETAVYDYRLPTAAELQALPPAVPLIKGKGELIPWTTDPHRPGTALRVVREQLPDRYRALLNYLANGRWQEADRETDRLMLEIADRKSQGYLNIEAIKQFPCADLRILDQLWVKFSGGQFGFSVQKQIWIEVGGKQDYVEDTDAAWGLPEDTDAAWEAYQKLADRVGWRVNKDWISYPDEVIFDTTALVGHLPSYPQFFVFGLDVWSGSVQSIFSRIALCRL